MRIKVVGENDVARAVRGLLRQAGFAVTEFLPADAVTQGPLAGYVIAIEVSPTVSQDQAAGADPARSGAGSIHIDSIDCPLEAAILKHITQLSKLPVVVDRPGGAVHSDREIAVAVPEAPEQQHAVEIGILRGLLELMNPAKAAEKAPPAKPWYQRLFS